MISGSLRYGENRPSEGAVELDEQEREQLERWTRHPRAVAAAFDPPLSALPDDAEVVVINTITGPRTARQLVHEVGEGLGLSPQRLTDLRIAVHELATNTILHAGGSGLL